MLSGPVPPRATRAVVIDDRGDEQLATIADGVWTADVDTSETLVRFTDAAGELVAPPVPEGDRERVRDAPEACPVCGHVAWVRIGSAVLCERCGHAAGSVDEADGGEQITFGVADEVEESVGQAFSAVEFGAEDEVVSGEGFEFDAGDFERRQAAILAALLFPVYAAAGHASSAAGRYDGKGEVFVHHDIPAEVRDFDDDDIPQLSVSTIPSGEARIQGPRPALSSMLDDGFYYVDRSPAGLLVAFAHRERQARRRVASAEPVERRITIDGRAEPFSFLAVDDAWVATREHAGVDVMVCARGIAPDDVTLEPLADPANAKAGTTGDAKRAKERERRDAAGELLSRAAVLRLIARHDLQPHRDAVLAAIRPGYWLLPGDAARTRIGGLPDLAPGERWPQTGAGFPYTFVAQIDCSALPPMESRFPARSGVTATRWCGSSPSSRAPRPVRRSR